MKQLAFILLASVWGLMGCEDSAPDNYEVGKCYEAKLIRGFCPSVAVVTVTNANIGIDWDYDGKSYKNAITIYNFKLDSLGPDRKIYFTIDTDAAAQADKCYLPIPCPDWLYDTSSPAVGICIKAISNRPCGHL